MIKQGRELTKDADEDKLLITVKEAARRLAIGRSHIYAQMQRGDIRSVRIGRSRRILERDLTDFIERLTDRSEGLPIGAVQPPRRSPVNGLPPRAGRR